MHRLTTLLLLAPLSTFDCGGSSDDPVEDTGEDVVAPYEDWSGAEGPFPVEGFGAATLGGWQDGADEVWVTSADDDGPGTLREALRTGDLPRVVRFDLTEPIALTTSLLVPSHITLDGRDSDVILTGKGLILAGSDDVILTHLTLQDTQGDGEDGLRVGDPTLGPSVGVVVDHVSFLQHGGGDSTEVDEAVSVIYGSHDITLQWCRFEAWEKVMLFGNGDADPAVDAEISVSVHHCYAGATGRRHPQARYGRFDFWNNVWDDWRMFGPYFEPPWRDSFGMLCEDDCRMLATSNAFSRRVHSDDAWSRANDATICDSGGVIEESGSWEAPESTAPLEYGVDCDEGATAFSRPYAAEIDDAGAEMWEKVETWAGR